MARYAIARVIGNGGPPRLPREGEDPEATGPFRPAIPDGLAMYRCLITAQNWCLVVIIEGDLVAIDALPKVRVIPDLALSHVLTNPQANNVNARLADMGAPAVASAGMTVLAVLNELRLLLGDETWSVG